jgi:hypothetical protein
MVLSLLWITKKIVENTSILKQNQLRYYLFYGPPENALRSKRNPLASFPTHAYVASAKCVETEPPEREHRLG